MAKKKQGPVRKAVREAQLVASVGAVLMVAYALVESALVSALINSDTLGNHGPVLGLLLVHGPLLLLAPLLCFGTRLIIDLNPWRLGIGSVLFTKAVLMLLRWVTGGFDEGGALSTLSGELVIALVIGAGAALAARYAAQRVQARAAVAAPAPSNVADLGEQLRQVQESARAAEPAPAPTADGALPPTSDKS